MTAPEAPARKPFEKRYKTVVPILLPANYPRPETIDDLGPGKGEGHPDLITARWLARESFENTAASDRLELVEYGERIIPLADVPPALVARLGDKPAEAWLWFEFTGLGRLDQDKFDWFAAEFVNNCDEWLAAERAHLQAIDDERLDDTPGGG